tara:strand:- start:1901 stop:3874 length:1974 start_codon:yes stop_codon:yes gene_type:complete
MAEKYFAAKPTDEVGSDIIKKCEEYYEYLAITGRYSLLERSYFQYFRALDHLGKLTNSGIKLEYTKISVNHFRNLIQHQLVMTTSQRPSFEAKATNDDYKSQTQCILAQGLLDYYMREKRLEKHFKSAVETSLWAGEGFICLEWDASEGKEYGVDEGEIVKDGDIVVKNYTPLDVIFDVTMPNTDHVDWYVLVEYKNKHELAAKFKKFKEKIYDIGKTDIRERYSQRLSMDRFEDSDLIPVYKFYHRPTLAVPGGRLVELLTPETILIDNPLPYKQIPVFRIAPNDQAQSPFGYSTAFDLLPLQETLDGLHSTAVTNISTFGVQNIAVPMGNETSNLKIEGGLNMIEFDPQIGPPVPLQLTATGQETYNYMANIEAQMETISGINSVSRGNPEASLKSGSALALVQSMAIQFNSGLESSYAALLEDVGTGIINILQEYANTPRISMIAGKSDKAMMKEWTKADLDTISRVVVDMGNPLNRTVAGKVNIAEQLIQAQLIKNQDQYMQVINTGRLEPLTEGIVSENLYIKNENEKMQDGGMVRAIWTDQHAQHIQEHKTLLANADARKDASLLERVFTHIQEHIDLLKQTPPENLMMTGQTPIPDQAQINADESMGPPELGDNMDSANPVLKEAKNISAPKMPKNPLTGEQFNMATGGL